MVRGSGVETIEHPWEGYRLSDVFQAADPRYRAFDAQAETRVRCRTVASQVQIPAKGVFWQVVLSYPSQQEVVVSDSLPASYDLSIPFGGEAVYG